MEKKNKYEWLLETGQMEKKKLVDIIISIQNILFKIK